MTRTIEAVLELARRRHELVASGDAEAYSAEDAALASACGALIAEGGTPGLGIGDVPLLDELIALETQSLRLLEGLMNETSARLEVLRKAGQSNGAYLRHERSL